MIHSPVFEASAYSLAATLSLCMQEFGIDSRPNLSITHLDQLLVMIKASQRAKTFAKT